MTAVTPPAGGGLQLTGYRLGEVIGRGGFATVHRAEQLSLGRQVAVKVLMADLATEAHRRRFDREREILVRLGAHPYVVEVHDAGITPENRPYIVMRLYRAGSLATRLRRHGAIPPGDVVALVTKVAEALDAVHALGVLHRDIKPENILLSDDGEPALSDFGISAITEREGTRTSTTFFTLSHAAPEVLNGQAFSAACDVYALASTTYELLAGRPAFEGVGLAAMRRVVGAAPPPIGRSDVPPALEAVVRRGLAKDPRHRYPTGGAFAADLRNAFAPPAGWTPPPEPPLPPPVPVPPPGTGASSAPGVAGYAVPGTLLVAGAPGVPGTRPRVPFARRPGMLAGALVAVLAIGAGVWALGREDDGPTGPVAQHGTSGPTAPAASPGASGDATGEATGAATATAGDDDPTLIPATKSIMSKDHFFAFDVDERTGRIATATDDWATLVWDPTTGAQVQRFETPKLGLTFGVKYRPDGAVLYGVGSGVRAWATKGATTARELGDKRDDNEWRLIGCTPDGSRLVTAVGARISPLLGFWDTTRGKRLSTMTMPGNVLDLAVTSDGRYVLVLLANQVSVLDMGGPIWTGRPVSTRAITFPQPFDTTDDVGLAVSPDGTTLATSTPEAPIQLWDLATGKATETLESGWVPSHAWRLAFSPDGERLVSDTYNAVQVWDLADGVVRWQLDVNRDQVNDVSFGADSSTVVAVTYGEASGSSRTRSWLRIWKLPGA